VISLMQKRHVNPAIKRFLHRAYLCDFALYLKLRRFYLRRKKALEAETLPLLCIKRIFLIENWISSKVSPTQIGKQPKRKSKKCAPDALFCAARV
jgi:hypothetical protein